MPVAGWQAQHLADAQRQALMARRIMNVKRQTWRIMKTEEKKALNKDKKVPSDLIHLIADKVYTVHWAHGRSHFGVGTAPRLFDVTAARAVARAGVKSAHDAYCEARTKYREAEAYERKERRKYGNAM